MDAQARRKRYGRKRNLTWLVAGLGGYLLLSWAVKQAWAGEAGATAFQFLFLIVFQIVQFVTYFGGMMYFLSSTRTDKIMPGDARSLALADYRGQPVILEKAAQIVSVLNGWSKIKDMGGEAPRGLLLIGGPGVGKTYLAQCLAGETEVPYILLDASGLVSMWMGMGPQPAGTPVLTPDGWTPIEELGPGDWVYGRAGDPIPVTDITAMGKQKVYRVTFTDGRHTRVTDHHLWKVRTHHSRMRAHPYYGKEHLRMTSLLKAGRHADAVALITPPKHPERNYFISPYVMGALVGDGNLMGTPTVSGNEAEILERCREEMGGFGHIEHYDKRVSIYFLSTGPGGSKGCNPVINELRRLGLWNMHGDSKFVPREYLLGSPEQRLDLLRGLMDTDGSISATRNRVTFSSNSRALCRGVVGLVRSLGGRARIREYLGRKELIVNVNLPIEYNPFWLERKANRLTPRTKHPVEVMTIKDVQEEPGKEETYCITVGSDDAVYVTQDYILTHNSIKVMRFFGMMKKYARRYGACVAFLDEVDAIGAARGGVEGQGIAMGPRGMFGGGGMGVLNTILSQMDGLDRPPGISGWLRRKFYGWLGKPLPKPDYTILVIASTNRPSVLDAALTRAGRFDLQWRITPPTEAGLADVIGYYLDKTVHDPEIDVGRVAASLRGATPADIRTAVQRNAVLRALAAERGCITESDILLGAWEAFLGVEMPEPEPYEADQHGTAAHEAGHAVACLALFPEMKLLLATIIPHAGTGRLGPTLGLVLPRLARERQTLPLDFLHRRLLMSMAGREGAALLCGGRMGLGFLGDRRNMQGALANMIMEGAFGYSASLVFGAGMAGEPSFKSLSKETQRQVEKMLERYQRWTRELLEENRGALEGLTELLLEEGTLTAGRLEQFLDEHPVRPHRSVEELFEEEEHERERAREKSNT